MINDIINNWAIGNILILFGLCGYILMRIQQRKLQKIKWRNNFEFWLIKNLEDYYKFNWYPNPWERAEKELKLIIENKNKECGLI